MGMDIRTGARPGLIFFWMRFRLRNFSEPAGVRVHPNSIYKGLGVVKA
jgi:hypothetical protein